MNNDKFSVLFKKYRLKSEIFTLSDFGKELAAKGYIYEDSIFSRWQKGNRVPKERKLLLAIVTLFVRRGGIETVSEINDLFESAGQGYVTNDELEIIKLKNNPNFVFQLPAEISDFTGRENYISEIKNQISKSNIVLLQGPAGIGKTSLAIKMGNLLRHDYADGVLWFRLDTSSINSILGGIARIYGENINGIKDIEIRSSMVRSLLSSKRALLILDNADLKCKINYLIPNSSTCKIIITSRYRNLDIQSNHSQILLKVFSESEARSLFLGVLGRKYVARNEKSLEIISKELGFLPIALKIAAKQLTRPRADIRRFLSMVKGEKIRLEDLKYENKNLMASVLVTFNGLDNQAKKVFTSLGIFGGKDFSLESVAFINNISLNGASVSLEELTDYSLVERSHDDRYRLHPLIKLFTRMRMDTKTVQHNAALYYEKFLSSMGRGDQKSYYILDAEIDNIIEIFIMCLRSGDIDKSYNLWKHIGVYFWDTGRWDMVESLGNKLFNKSKNGNYELQRGILCTRELSWLYYWKGQVNDALKFVDIGLKIGKKLNDQYLIAYSKQRKGKILQANKDYKRAQELLKDSHKIFSLLEEHERVGDTLTYLGENYILLNNFQSAMYYLEEALNVTRKINDINQYAIILGDLGEIYYCQGKLDEASDCFKQSLEIAHKKGMNVGGKVWCNMGLAMVANEKNDISLILKHIKDYKVNLKRLGIQYDKERPLIKKFSEILIQFHQDSN